MIGIKPLPEGFVVRWGKLFVPEWMADPERNYGDRIHLPTWDNCINSIRWGYGKHFIRGMENSIEFKEPTIVLWSQRADERLVDVNKRFRHGYLLLIPGDQSKCRMISWQEPVELFRLWFQIRGRNYDLEESLFAKKIAAQIDEHRLPEMVGTDEDIRSAKRIRCHFIEKTELKFNWRFPCNRIWLARHVREAKLWVENYRAICGFTFFEDLFGIKLVRSAFCYSDTTIPDHVMDELAALPNKTQRTKRFKAIVQTKPAWAFPRPKPWLVRVTLKKAPNFF